MHLWRWARPHAGRFAGGIVAVAITNALGYYVPGLLRRAIDGFSSGATVKEIGGIALWIFVIACVQAGIRITSRLLIFNAARDVEQDIRLALFQHILAWSPERQRRYAIGDLQSRLTNDLTNVRLLFGASLLNIVNTAFAYALALPLLFLQSPRLALIALAPYPFLALFMVTIARRVFLANVVAQERLGDLSNLVNEDLGARLFISASGLGGVEERRFAAKNDAYLETNLRLVRLRATFFPVMSLLGSLGIILALYFGGREVMAGRMSVGALVAVTSYLGLLTFPTLMLGFMVAVWQRGRASWARIETLFAEPEWPERQAARAASAAETALRVAAPSITLSHVSVSRGETRVLADVSLDIAAGARVGIVGEIGSGKSTLLSVLARLVEVPRGTYALSGVDVNDVSLTSVRNLIGLVPQQPFLFSMSVDDNVGFGKSDSRPEDRLAALRAAAVDAEMTRLPEGLATEIGERGVTLSGGQKQRVALARALLRQPRILLLDDCFSAVDSDTEQTIIGNLRALDRSQTLIIATHRMAVLDTVDRVLVMRRGNIIEDGTPAELLSRESAYRELWDKQRLAHELHLDRELDTPVRRVAS